MAMMTRTPERQSVNSHVLDGVADRHRAVVEHGDLDAARQLDLDGRQHRLHPVDHLDGVGVGLAVDGEQDGAGAVEPARDLVVLDAVDRGGDVGDAHRRAVLERHDHRHVVGRLVERAGGVEDGVLARIGDGAERLGRVGVDDGGLQLVQRQAAHRELVEVGAHAHGVFLRAEDQHLGDAGQGRDARQDGAVGEGVDVGQPHLRGLERQEQDREVGGVDLAEAGRRRQLDRQAAHGGRDLRLHVERGAVDVTVEVELQDDRGVSERRGRGHRRHAGDGRELPLEDRGDRGSHRLGAGAGKLGRHLDGRKVDARHRGDRQVLVAEDAGDDERRHQQDGHHRAADAKRGHGRESRLRVSRAAARAWAARSLQAPAWRPRVGGRRWRRR